ncbi:hypothetical protein P3T24_006589 [Paraburkholderia sp. GAS33]|uniref:DUF746 domain-containing protein n=1 Tax=Paraburkholderia sp. GAS33 TaxID=3035130 RepID=UPI003D1A7E8E
MSKLDIFLPLLSQPFPFAHAAALMGSLPEDIKKRVLAIRLWLLRIDPSGEWERRVRLGGVLPSCTSRHCNSTKPVRRKTWNLQDG